MSDIAKTSLSIVPTLLLVSAIFIIIGCSSEQVSRLDTEAMEADRLTLQRESSGEMADKVNKTEAEWRQILTPEQYAIVREGGTERAFTGIYWDHKETGQYLCAGCGKKLFASTTKYESGCGWPSFYEPTDSSAVREKTDMTLGMARTEIRCSSCDAHLGHVFTDGPKPTGLRYCINSASLDFTPTKSDSTKKTEEKK